MFSKILIANRGEIACRVIRTARRLGIATVAVYSDADKDAVHVGMADEAVRLGPPPAPESYLRIDAIVDACRATGAEAVHPGYGFLSENPRFVRALADAGVGFIGPGADAIEAMGDKIAAKKIAAAAGVSTVPGHAGVVASADAAAKVARKLGFPVMLKAAAGGGGRGMRIARDEAEARDGLASAMNEARQAFGDDRIFVEKLIADPRHVEIQVLADRHGNVVHLGERECSLQRRNQKVVEEAPSPLLDADTRAAMGAQAVALARAVGYESAGTVEFIADQGRNFYFLEMNARLQVEHPVTELVTGLDIVELMIRIAAGERLPLAQDDVRLDGWAIEARVYAEDPYRNFLPSVGRLTRYRPPREQVEEGLTIRNDTGVEEGSQISVFYDPLIAKLCTHGPTREAATDHMRDALDRFSIVGIEHNIPFLTALMHHPRWREGRLSTAFIAEEYPDGFHGEDADAETLGVMIAAAAVMGEIEARRRRGMSGRMDGHAVEITRERVVALGREQHAVAIDTEAGQFRVSFGDETGWQVMTVETGWRPGMLAFAAEIDGRSVTIQVRPILNGHRLVHRGVGFDARVYTPRQAELAALMPVKAPPDTSAMLLCPMPGVVVSIAVGEGQQVKAGETLCVIEAMKMENVLRAERDATVARISVEPGASLAVGAVIMEFE